MQVTLEWYEVSRAALVGVSRNVEALRRGYQQKLKGKDESWERHVLGALGECAFAKATNRYWSGSVNTFKAADVGANIQIRTRSRHSYDLIVREDDNSDDLYVLVTGGPHEYEIHGWISARDAKHDRYRANYGQYGEAYFVPAKDLHPIDNFICQETT